jgi:hypothetical protein
VAGRDTPRESGPPVVHDVKFRANEDGMTVYCDPCDWRAGLEPGHTDEDYERLKAMHEGASQDAGNHRGERP